ncbi:hypothetical protein JOD64_003335 [Micromonospora luteifusca]|uniref:Uncharacterized protein n=1 Tax=Micromonospora luteifusca TaxID=709860 RepID=A0ABS2LWB9_9ACTN|nr:hypothetical protein [Micromonospora luteifusca]MBM7492113.1 hypothetical protein [Micromonospora luteifusca]
MAQAGHRPHRPPLRGVLAAAWCARAVPTPSILAAAFVPFSDQRLYQLLPRSDVP